MTCVDSRHWNGADSAREKGEGLKPLRRREGYRTNEYGEGRLLGESAEAKEAHLERQRSNERLRRREHGAAVQGQAREIQ